MEELVRSVFRDFLNCEVHYFTNNTYSADGGVDLVALEGNSGIEIAIQVKRRVGNTVESVSEIREFVGAMAIEGFQKGIFVTTGRFSKVAKSLPNRINNLFGPKTSLELIDSERFNDLIKRTQRASEESHSWKRLIDNYRHDKTTNWNKLFGNTD